MKYYISAPLPYKIPAEAIANVLRNRGHWVLSTWHLSTTDTGYGRSPEDLGEDAIKDINEVALSDALVVISKDGSGGGMHGEICLALALDKKVYAFGKKLSVWSYHPAIKWFEDEEDFLRWG